jgi:hypothetical protein
MPRDEIRVTLTLRSSQSLEKLVAVPPSHPSRLLVRVIRAVVLPPHSRQSRGSSLGLRLETVTLADVSSLRSSHPRGVSFPSHLRVLPVPAVATAPLPLHPGRPLPPPEGPMKRRPLWSELPTILHSELTNYRFVGPLGSGVQDDVDIIETL